MEQLKLAFKKTNSFFIFCGIIFSMNANALPRFDAGYMMRFAKLDYVDSSGTLYGLTGSTGSDIYVSMSGYLGSWNLQFYSNTRSTTFKVPANIPGPSLASYYSQISDQSVGFRLGYGRANIRPFLGILTEGIVVSPVVALSFPFSITKETLNYVSLGAVVFGTGSRPTLETRGSIELRMPISNLTFNNTALKSSYSTQINVEVNFGKNRNLGLMGSIGVQEYSDLNKYQLIYFSGGLGFGF